MILYYLLSKIKSLYKFHSYNHHNERNHLFHDTEVIFHMNNRGTAFKERASSFVDA